MQFCNTGLSQTLLSSVVYLYSVVQPAALSALICKHVFLLNMCSDNSSVASTGVVSAAAAVSVTADLSADAAVFEPKQRQDSTSTVSMPMYCTTFYELYTKS